MYSPIGDGWSLPLLGAFRDEGVVVLIWVTPLPDAVLETAGSDRLFGTNFANKLGVRGLTYLRCEIVELVPRTHWAIRGREQTRLVVVRKEFAKKNHRLLHVGADSVVPAMDTVLPVAFARRRGLGQGEQIWQHWVGADLRDAVRLLNSWNQETVFGEVC